MKKVAVDVRVIRFPNGSVITVTDREWKHYCDDCNDSGYLNHWCGSEASPKSWVTRRTCDRRHTHGSHEWVRLCPCAATNPDVPAPVKARARAVAKESDHAPTRADRG